MKKIIKTFLVLLVVVSFISCNSSKKVEETTENFFYAIKNEDKIKMEKLYPTIDSLPNLQTSDSIKIKEIKKLRSKNYSVSLFNYFYNSNYKIQEREVTLYLMPDSSQKSNNEYIIFDSKGYQQLVTF